MSISISRKSNNNNNNKTGMVYEKVVAVNDFSSSNGDDALAAEAAAVSAVAPSVSRAVNMRAFSMEQGGGGGGERRRRRRQGGGRASLSVQEENENRLRMLVVNDDENDDDVDASSDGSSHHNEMFEQEFATASNGHEHDMMLHGHTSNNITVRQAFIHLLKGYVGPGCLSLPWAMSQLGISMGIFMIFVICTWSSYNCRVVLLLKRHYQNQEQASCLSRQHHQHQQQHHHHNNNITYPQLAEWLYPGRNMHRFTTLCICIQQLAVCTVFLSFTGTNLQAVYMAVWHVELSHQLVISLALPAVLALSCLPNLKALAPVTFLATILLMLGFALIGVVIAKVEWSNKNNEQHTQHYSQYDDSDSTTTGPNYKNWPMAICAILYSFEGICLVLPVEQAMTPQQAKRHFMPTFAIAMLTASTIFATLSYFCVTAFGPITNGSITAFLLQKYGRNDHGSSSSSTSTNNHANDHDNLTHNGLRRFMQDSQEQQEPYLMDWLLAANAVVSLSVLITYPLQIFPALELAEPILNPTTTSTAMAQQQRDADGLELIPQHDDDDENDNDVNHHHPHQDNDDNLNNHASPKQGTALVGDHKHKKKNHCNDKANDNIHDDDLLPFQMVAHHQQPSSQRGARREAPNNNNNSKNNGVIAAKGLEIGNTTTAMEISAADETNTAETTNNNDTDKDDDDEENDDNVASIKTRIILVLLTFVVAVAVPNVQVLISLAGALAGSSVALLIPPALEIAWLFKCQEQATAAATSSSMTTTLPPLSIFTRDLIRCYLLFALGFLFLCIGTGASLLDIYETNHQGSSATISPNGDDTGP